MSLLSLTFTLRGVSNKHCLLSLFSFVFFCCLFICIKAVVDQLPITLVGEERANLSAVVYL